jgi:peptidoglycan/xylan/chitin deacetylase (PgdA/CDA1 family)
MFVTTAATWSRRPQALGGRRTMSWKQIGELPSSGVEVGAHSHDHHQLDLLPARTVAEQLSTCKDLLQQAVQQDVPSFAYPHGYNRRATRRLVRAAGFESACGVSNAVSHPEDDRWSMSRIMLTSDQTVADLEVGLTDHGWASAGRRPFVRTVAWRAARMARTRGRPLVTVTEV